jgi:hypothetical protein
MLDYMTHQVLVYQSCQERGSENALKQILMDELSLHVYSYPGRRHSLNEEDWSDFLLGFHGKLQDILISFHYRGPSFWGYLNKVLEWQLLSYYRQAVQFRQAEWICERESIIEYDCSPEAQDFCLLHKISHILDNAGFTDFRTDALRQRLLILVLKNIVFISEDDYLSVFPLLGPGSREAGEYRDLLLELMKRKFERKNKLELKRCENYYKLTLAEKKRSEEIDREALCRFNEKIKLYRRRLNRLDRQINSIPMYPSNEDISEILCLPKGSVDSGLYYLKNYLEAVYGEGQGLGLGCSGKNFQTVSSG